MKFKIGTYVITNPDSVAVQEDEMTNLGGKVIEYDGFLNSYTVQLDAQSLNTFSEEAIRYNAISYLIMDEYEFEEPDLLPAERRDTDEEYATAKARITRIEQAVQDAGLIDDQDFDPETDDPSDLLDPYRPERMNKVILHEFEHSNYLKVIPEEQRSSYVSTAEMMLEVAHNHFGHNHPEEWLPPFIEEFALNYLPRKVMASPEEFTTMGKELTAFIDWLWQAEITDCGRRLYKTMRDAAPKMVKASKDDSNFGFAKLLMGQAKNEGVDLSDQDQLDAFVQNFNNRPFEEREAITGGPAPPYGQPAKVVGLDPFRKLGRNDRITVRDVRTGEVQEKVKFKNVEKRLRSGELELVES